MTAETLTIPTGEKSARAPGPGGQHAGRLHYIDGLRGVASLAVVMFHFAMYFGYAKIKTAFAGTDWFITASSYGFLGVQVFFVLSGFVITYSLRDARMSGDVVIRFIARRSLRIDPPYWSTIALILLIALAGRLAGGGAHAETVNFKQVAAHLFYLQDLLGYRPLSPVFWTLCLEIQFYLAFVLMGYLVWKLAGSFAWRAHVALCIALFGVSLAIGFAGKHTPGWFVEWWYMFALGAVTCWVSLKRLPAWVLVAMLAAATVLAVMRFDVGAVVAVVTSTSIFAASRLNRMGSWLNWGWLQFCGRVSYSLYLLHSIVGIVIFYRFPKFFGRSELTVWLFIVVATAASCIAAWVMHRLIEAPSMSLAKRIAPRKASAATSLVVGSPKPES